MRAVEGRAILSEEALAPDWERPEEDEAWAHLQQADARELSRTSPNRCGVAVSQCQGSLAPCGRRGPEAHNGTTATRA